VNCRSAIASSLAAPLQGDTLCTVDESVLRVAGELGIAAVELA